MDNITENLYNKIANELKNVSMSTLNLTIALQEAFIKILENREPEGEVGVKDMLAYAKKGGKLQNFKTTESDAITIKKALEHYNISYTCLNLKKDEKLFIFKAKDQKRVENIIREINIEKGVLTEMPIADFLNYNLNRNTGSVRLDNAELELFRHFAKESKLGFGVVKNQDGTNDVYFKIYYNKHDKVDEILKKVAWELNSDYGSEIKKAVLENKSISNIDDFLEKNQNSAVALTGLNEKEWFKLINFLHDNHYDYLYWDSQKRPAYTFDFVVDKNIFEKIKKDFDKSFLSEEEKMLFEIKMMGKGDILNALEKTTDKYQPTDKSPDRYVFDEKNSSTPLLFSNGKAFLVCDGQKQELSTAALCQKLKTGFDTFYIGRADNINDSHKIDIEKKDVYQSYVAKMEESKKQLMLSRDGTNLRGRALIAFEKTQKYNIQSLGKVRDVSVLENRISESLDKNTKRITKEKTTTQEIER